MRYFFVLSNGDQYIGTIEQMRSDVVDFVPCWNEVEELTECDYWDGDESDNFLQ